MYQSYIKQLENIMRINLERRGMDKVILEGELEKAALELWQGTTVVIVTGFVIKDYLIGETDGPLGAIALAGALEQLGKRVVLITDHYSKDILEHCSITKKINAPIEIIAQKTEIEFSKDILRKYQPSHIIAVERPGRNVEGKFYSMLGEDISAIVPNTDILFEEASKQGIITIAIGDGGNELGMGKIHSYVTESISNGQQICATFCTDLLIIAGVSNWGGYALTAALSIQARQMLLHDINMEKILLERIVGIGAIDGYSKKRTLTVDGLSWQENIRVFEMLRNTAEEAIIKLP